jgi:hypothetical protein
MLNPGQRYRFAATHRMIFCFAVSFPFASTQAIEAFPDEEEIDPHIYAYTAEFAKRFGMPAEWISDELIGVDAVAYRAMPTYMSCGWAARLDICFKHETQCELDLYFDQRRNPLHWDERHPHYETSAETYSSNFISSSHLDRSPERAGEDLIVRKSPLIDSDQGRGVTWRYRYNNDKGRGSGYALDSGYERDVFEKVDRVTLNLGCFTDVNHVDLVTEDFLKSRGKVIEGIVKTVIFPEIWKYRKELADKNKASRLDIFLREEGEKVLKILRKKPVQSPPIFLGN